MADNKKTIEEWLTELPQPYRTQALTNWRKCDWLSKHNKEKSLTGAIMYGFEWDATPEGHKYWERIAEGDYSTSPPTTAVDAIHAISLKLGFPAEDIIAIRPWTNAPHGKWEYQTKHEIEQWIFIDLSNP